MLQIVEGSHMAASANGCPFCGGACNKPQIRIVAVFNPSNPLLPSKPTEHSQTFCSKAVQRHTHLKLTRKLTTYLGKPYFAATGIFCLCYCAVRSQPKRTGELIVKHNSNSELCLVFMTEPWAPKHGREHQKDDVLSGGQADDK